MSDYIPTTAAGWLEKALRFIDAHPDGWTLLPGQDLHGWLLRAQEALEAEQKKAINMITTAMRIGWREPATMVDVPPHRTAEDERRDVLAFLAAEEAKQDCAIGTFANAGDERAADRSGVRASLVRSIRAYIERGDHVGAANR